ncbi:MAG: AAA family ATPase, partial [Roseburia sp.]|nr:AAA family ATPase [Roseburia sp.]
MGIYLNPGNKSFWESIRSEIYVDKTGLIAYTNKYMNTEQKYLCVSRPRRFGKSMALKMLAAYYSRGCDSKELFAGYKIERDETFQEHLNQYDVIYLNIQQFLIETETGRVIEYLEQEVTKELYEEYHEVLKDSDLRLAAAL